jgi:aspartyl-tRNA(Asn)/glutamyl-tRNA(Gln) amidotransferase subunit A
MALAALGSDTGGSIRLPASFCGITGFKLTYGRVPTDGVAPLAWSLDHVGPMTRTARDAALLHGVLSGKPISLQPVKELRLGLARNPYWQGLDGDVERAIYAAVKTMKRFTREVRDVQLPALPDAAGAPLPKTYATVIYSEAYTFHREMLARNPDRYHTDTRTTIELGKPISAADYIQDRRDMERLRATATSILFKDVDLLITPTAPGPAFKLGSQPPLVFLRNTAPWNRYGLPTISIPCGFSQSGLPIGPRRSRRYSALAGG